MACRVKNNGLDQAEYLALHQKSRVDQETLSTARAPACGAASAGGAGADSPPLVTRGESNTGGK